ncbi:MAG: hypothetical protein HRU32_02535, partial [Rhodobacteraceae bacterium]|nr:hypothetical protein [Paracoccaceae bacterium]
MTDFPHAVAPSDPPSAPRIKAPEGAWDAHVHLVAGAGEYPLWEGRVEDPAPGPTLDDWLAIFRRHLDTLGLSKGLIVHSILYGADNSVTIEAVRRLGPGFKGVGLVTDDATDSDLDALVAANMVAVRLNYVHGGARWPRDWPRAGCMCRCWPTATCIWRNLPTTFARCPCRWCSITWPGLTCFWAQMTRAFKPSCGWSETARPMSNSRPSTA